MILYSPRLFLVPLFHLLLLPVAQASTVELFWNVSYVENVNPDGLFPRRAIGVNGQWPIPPIRVTQDDTLLIHVYNGLVDDGGETVRTAIHSHGLFFNGTVFWDGAVGVTQCPIPTSQTFTYNIPVSEQYGTYWIHGHYDGQYVDGLRTPLIILPKSSSVEKNLEYDRDYTIVLADWYHDEYPTLIKKFISSSNPDGVEPVPNSALLYILNEHSPTPLDLAAIANGSVVGDNAVLQFKKGKKYLLRVINMSGLASFWFGVGGHNMSVVALDSTDVEPYPADMIPLTIGQRANIVIEGRSDSEADSNDWPIMANMDPDMFDEIPDGLQMNLTARLTYSKHLPSGLPLEPATIFDEYPVFNELALVPLQSETLLKPDVRHVMDVYLNEFDDGTNRGSFNNITYRAPIVPSLITALTMSSNDSRITEVYGGTEYSVIYGAQTHAVVLDHMDVVEVIIRNFDDGPHPFHLHGHVFQIVEISDDTEVTSGYVGGVSNPIRRDVVQVPGEGSATIRFRADNPGVWFFHCHIEWHLDSGLASVFVEAPERLQATMKLPSGLLDQCAHQGIPTSGNVVGRNSTTDFTGQPFGPFPLVGDEAQSHHNRFSMHQALWITGALLILVGLVARKRRRRSTYALLPQDTK